MPIKKYPIYHVSFEDQYLCTSTLLRIHEAHEHPLWKRKVFTFEDFMDWYAKKHGNFSYCEDFVGYAFRGSALTHFKENSFPGVTRKERKFLRMMKDVPKDAVIIATGDVKKDVVAHEFIHALDFLYSDFRKEAYAVIREYDLSIIRAKLLKDGYEKEDHDAEILAYVLTGLNEGMNCPTIPLVRKALKRCLIRNFGFQLPGRGPRRMKFCQDRMHHRSFRWKDVPEPKIKMLRP